MEEAVTEELGEDQRLLSDLQKVKQQKLEERLQREEEEEYRLYRQKEKSLRLASLWWRGVGREGAPSSCAGPRWDDHSLTKGAPRNLTQKRLLTAH